MTKELFEDEAYLDFQLKVQRAKVDHLLSRRWMRRVRERDNNENWTEVLTFNFTIPYDETKAEQVCDKSFAMRSF